ncbi:MAG: serine hydrolase [Pseudomonadota bacterium]
MARLLAVAAFSMLATSCVQLDETERENTVLIQNTNNETASKTDNCVSEAHKEIDAFVAGLDATAVEVLHLGEPIYSYGDVSRTEGLYVASVRKSLLALLYGPWVENGTIDLDATLDDLGFDDIEGLTSQEKRATIRDLITSRSGVFHPASNGGDDPNKPVRGSKEPGEYFLYNNWDFNAAGAVFEHLTERSIYTAFDEQIAKPIGLQDYDAEWNEENRPKIGPDSASKYPAYHFSLSARDLARVGQLVAQKGTWQGETVISEAWIDEMLTAHTTMEEVEARRPGQPFAYGYMWWLVEAPVPFPVARSSVWAQGAWGQKIMANSELGLSAGLVTEPRYVDDDGEERAVNTSTPDTATIIQMAWDGHQNCNAQPSEGAL